MASLRSMTGFARLRRVNGRGELIFTMKGVNHRSLDLHLHLPADLELYEYKIRTAIKSRVSRGHVELRVTWNRAGDSTSLLSLNEPLFTSWLSAFQKARDRYALPSDPDVNAALRIPGMLREADPDPDEALERELLELTDETASAFNHSREKEGGGLRHVMDEANMRILEHAAELAGLRAQALPLLEERLRERLTQLLAISNLEPQRVVQEAAVLADRSDITEEIHRLTIHSRQLSELLEKGGEAGKKIDFLMQEMGRETNTILSKTSGAGELGLRITDLGIAVKAEIERIREQALNLE